MAGYRYYKVTKIIMRKPFFMGIFYKPVLVASLLKFGFLKNL